MKNIKLYFLLLAVLFVISACSYSEKNDTGNDISGQGGSLARFTVVGDYLYTVDPTKLHSLSINDAEHPKEVASKILDMYTETIFPYENSLLLGTESGMIVLDLTNPANPSQVSNFQHIRSCDPVVAENGYAYITLNASSQRCSRGLNELQIVDISNLYSPQLVKTLSISAPLGLDIHNDTLFICDNGLRIYNVEDKQNPELINYFQDITARDVIYNEGRLIAIGNDGLHQYQQSGGNYHKISTISIQP